MRLKINTLEDWCMELAIQNKNGIIGSCEEIRKGEIQYAGAAAREFDRDGTPILFSGEEYTTYRNQQKCNFLDENNALLYEVLQLKGVEKNVGLIKFYEDASEKVAPVFKYINLTWEAVKTLNKLFRQWTFNAGIFKNEKQRMFYHNYGDAFIQSAIFNLELEEKCETIKKEGNDGATK